MIKNYFKTAFRFLLKNKTFSFINIIGLAIGTVCCLYIVLFVKNEYSYDKHHKDGDHIYRIDTDLKLSGEAHLNATSSPPIAPAMKNDFAEVKQYTRVVNAISVSQHLLRYKDKSFYEKKALFADSTFFDVFSYHFVHGTPSNALAEPYSIVLFKPVADKLFGGDNPVGQTIEMDNAYGKHDFKVTAVIDESDGNTHIHADFIMTMNSGGIGEYVRGNNTWAGNNFAFSYVKLNPLTSAADLEKKLPAFLEKYGGEQLKSKGMDKKLILQPIASIHTTKGYANELDKTVSPSFLYILLLIAAMIQLIACINFMNLSTARATKRAKEVGVRKVIGASRKQLVKQFLGESLLLSVTAMLVALPLLWILLPYLNSITHAAIEPALFFDLNILLLVLGLILVTGVLAGSYPAFYLSAFQAIRVMKGNFSNYISAAGIRRSLVVFQFVLSIALIIGIIVIYSQLRYIKNKDLGFDQNQQLIFSFHTDDTKAIAPSFMNALRQLPEVKAVSRANNYISQFVFNDMTVHTAGGTMANGPDAQFMRSDEYFVKASGIKMISGRDFRVHDSARILINETLAHRLGLDPATAPGTRVYSEHDDGNISLEIVGVMKDFNYNSLHSEVRSFMLAYSPDQNQSHLIVNTATDNYKTLLGKIETVWKQFLPAVPFEYAFLDDQIQKQYESELTFSRIINSFTIIAILISCLGLFGLATFSAEQRTREIGIRKIVGASGSSIVALLSKDFLKLVAIAIVIASPIAGWAMSKWLEAFAYRIPVSWWMFAMAGGIAILIAVITVSFQAIKAAVANPVKSLRTE